MNIRQMRCIRSYKMLMMRQSRAASAGTGVRQTRLTQTLLRKRRRPRMTGAFVILSLAQN